ncbi:MAG TPA: Yip1 family protein [Candidatus Nanoarchaeia archaeon]|nr:Yip1 family protein [Candidatus Nanoarchaeia archaeon]
MNPFQTAIAIISKPNAFLPKLRKEKGIQDAFLYFLLFAAIAVVFSAGVIMRQAIPSPFPLFFGLLFGFGISIAGIFISTGIIHLMFLLVRGKGAYEKTFQAAVYAKTPSMLLAPFQGVYYAIFGTGLLQILASLIVGIPVLIYQIHIALLFFAEVHKVTKMRSFVAAYVLPVLLAVSIALGIGIFAALIFLRSGGMLESWP